MQLRWVCLASALTILPAAPSAAQDGDDNRARLHFEAGRSYYEEGAYEQALEEFSRAYGLSHRPALLSNMANCEDRLGRWAEAADHLQEYATTLEAGSQERSILERRIENLRTRASAAQRPEPAAPSTATPSTTGTAATVQASDGLLVPSIVAFGVGGAGIAAWAVLGAMALGEQATIANGCGATRSCTPAQVEPMDNLALAADISLVTGIVGVAVGAVLLLVDPPHGASPTAMIVPVASPRAAGVALTGAW